MITVQGLEKRYGDLQALAGVTFEVPRGQIVGFLGPNGAGKSTTMKILTGSLVADAGHCEIAGRRVLPNDPESRRRVGYLPESTPLYRSMRVDGYLDFVAGLHGLDRSARRKEVGRVIAACHLGRHAGRRIAWLSKGFRQRVGLAQALLGDPEVLILDEPTSGLDPREVVRMRDLIRELGEERTVMLSTHVLSEVEAVCARALVIAGGRLVADGDPLELARGQAARLCLALRVPATAAALDAKAVGEHLLGVPGVERLVEARELGGRTLRLVLEVKRAPGSGAADDYAGEPVAELLADAALAKGWKISELTWLDDDFEASFLRLTDPAVLAEAAREARRSAREPSA